MRVAADAFEASGKPFVILADSFEASIWRCRVALPQLRI